MKTKLLYIAALFVLFFAACNPMDDILDEYDEIKDPITANIEFTLEDADYESIADLAIDAGFGSEDDANFIAANMYFTEEIAAAEYIPYLIAENYPALGVNSVANITYSFYNDYPEYLANYTEAAEYELVATDYPMMDTTYMEFFSPSYPAENYVSSALNNAFPAAEDGDILLVTYEKSDSDPVIEEPNEPVIEVIFEENWDEDTVLGDFTGYSVVGDDQNWYWDEYSGDGFAKMAGFSGTTIENEDWLVTKSFDLNGYDSYILTFNHAINYIFGEFDQLSVLISTDFDGNDVTTASWTELTVPTWPAGDSWTFSESGEISLNDYAGSQVFIAFRYTSSSSVASTWEINDFVLTGITNPNSSKGENEVYEISDYYQLDDTAWVIAAGVYYLNSFDYDEMGAPGYYDNFSSSTPAENYLPAFLMAKYPFAQTEDMIVIVYKYYSDGISLIASEYSFDGTWSAYNPLEEKTGQFLRSTDGWIFDPTVIFTMSNDDYQLIVDYAWATYPDEVNSDYDNSEYYYGASAYYGNFDIRAGNFNSKFTTWEEAVQEGIQIGLLPSKFPNAVAEVSGIPVKYVVDFATYSGADGTGTMTFECTKSAPNPEFTFVE